MIPNLLNTLLGLWLTYAAIFPVTVGAHYHRWLFGAAIVTIALALWARRGDYAPWQSTMTIIAAVTLAVILAADRFLISSAVLLFWGVLWVGLVSATVSLWAAIYRPDVAAAPS
jgi:predicted ferric reductase